jgi:glycosyltransferase involved in cell wall biosynthesis
MLFSFIIPVFNRPDELDELLNCIEKQTKSNFEIIIIEDGSIHTSEKIIDKYKLKGLNIIYIYKENAGQGFARNDGFKVANGDYFIILDSDALIESNYLEIVENEINAKHLDLYGGPDKDHPSFTPIQKAISYSMTSLFTTGGIRGKKANVGGIFHPRSFNMGISRNVYEQTKGFKITRMGEDIEFSIRCIANGFKSGLIEKAFIYHKRRATFKQFYKQLHFFGRARINIGRFFPNELKWIHYFPLLYLVGSISCIIIYILYPYLLISNILISLWILYNALIGIDSGLKYKSLQIAFLSIIASNIQLSAYGLGFIQEKFNSIKNKN